MKTKKILKFIVAILLALTLVTAFTTCTFADSIISDDGEVEISGFTGAGDTGGADTAVTNIIGAILTIARIIGAGVAVIMLIVLAIKYISASPEGKGDIKKTSTVYIAGAIILFAASAILTIIQNFALNIEA